MQMTNRGRFSVAIGLAAVVATFAAGCSSAKSASVASSSSRPNQAMASTAAEVMPFDLNATTHTFAKTAQGGVETVVADDPGDGKNIALIRSHLAKERDKLAQGHFDDPAAIHGQQMPGLQQLAAGAARIFIRYEEIQAGARIIYTTSDATLVNALHTWFDAQNHDHAMPGMGG